MSVFEYLIALVSVVIGLAIARTLGGILQLVHHRDSVRVDWLPLVWTGTLLLWTVFFWWFTFGMAEEATTWRMRNLLFVLGYASTIYFVLGMLYPADIGQGFDMRAHFAGAHRWFFGWLFILVTFDVFDTTYKIVNRLGMPEPFYFVVLSTLVIGSAIGWRVQSRRYHVAFGIVFAALVVVHVVFNQRMMGQNGIVP